MPVWVWFCSRLLHHINLRNLAHMRFQTQRRTQGVYHTLIAYCSWAHRYLGNGEVAYSPQSREWQRLWLSLNSFAFLISDRRGIKAWIKTHLRGRI